MTPYRPALSAAVRAPGAPILLLVLAVLAACNPPTYPPVDKAVSQAEGPSTSTKTAPATHTVGGDTAAAEAIVLIQDNKERCLKISRDGAKIMDDAILSPPSRYERAEDSPRAQLRKFLETEVKSESFLVDAVEDLIRQSLARIDRSQQRDVAILLRSLFDAQQQLCRAALRDYVSSVDDYRGQVSASLYGYTQTEQRLNALVRVSDAERQRILLQHQSALMAVAQAVGGSYRPMVMGSGGNYAPARRKTPEEWERERREYEEKLRRREQMQSEHQRSVGEWRNRDQPQGAMPTAGVSERPTTVAVPMPRQPAPASPLQTQMTAWHRDYANKVYPVKLAIQRYLQARTSGDLQFLEPACRNLKSACDTLLMKRGVLYAPDPAIKRDLEEAFTRFQMVGATCRDDQVDAANRAFERAGATLRTYGLNP